MEFQQTLTDYTEKTSIQLPELRFFLFSRFFSSAFNHVFYFPCSISAFISVAISSFGTS